MAISPLPLSLTLALFLIHTLTLPSGCLSASTAKVSMIDSLLADLTRDQIPADVPVSLGTWERQKGLWPSAVKLNFNGVSPVSTLLRRKIQFPDNNMYVYFLCFIAFG